MALVPLLTRIGRTHDVMIWLVARSLLLLPMTQKKKQFGLEQIQNLI